ncbi:hypothetical protein VPH35_020631 [Triticum aestivum]
MHVPPPVALPCAHFLPSAACMRAAHATLHCHLPRLGRPPGSAQVQNFGEPFFMVIREDETLSSIKECLQKKLKVSDEDFSKWKFAYISLGCPDYFEDSDTVATRFQDWLLKLMTEPRQQQSSCCQKIKSMYMEVDDCYSRLKSVFLESGTSEEFSLLLPQLERSKAIVDKAKLKSATSVEDMH